MYYLSTLKYTPNLRTIELQNHEIEDGTKSSISGPGLRLLEVDMAIIVAGLSESGYIGPKYTHALAAVLRECHQVAVAAGFTEFALAASTAATAADGYLKDREAASLKK